MKRYQFEIFIDEQGRVGVKHNCDNLLEFLGVLELAKAVGLKMFHSSAKEERQFNPEDYLKQVQQNTKQVTVKGIVKTMQ